MHGEEILSYLPEKIVKEICQMEPDWENAEEIRLRVEKPVIFYMNNREYVLSCKIKQEDIQWVLDRVTGHSLYAYPDELCQGYFTVEGGHRIGIAGKAVVENGKIRTQKYMSFLNIRIAHEKKGCAKKVIAKLMKDGRLKHTLIISPPGCGKTTLIRDLVRLISNGFYYINECGIREYFHGITVGVVDERSEIGACVKGVPVNDLGIRTDVLDGCPKQMGIFLLLRSMAPKVIAVDEIGQEEDLRAIRQAVNSGCIILATAHGSSMKELKEKRHFASFIEENIFERYVILSGKHGKGTIEEICYGGEKG